LLEKGQTSQQKVKFTNLNELLQASNYSGAYGDLESVVKLHHVLSRMTESKHPYNFDLMT
jgi:hypothetical protein